MGASAAQVGSGIFSTGMSLFQTIQGAKEKRDAREALENYERQTLENAVEGETVSRLGADIRKEEQARLASSQISALQDSGTRGLIGGLGRVEANNNLVNREIGADLDMQQKDIDRRISEDNARIRAIQEQREREDIMALSSQYNAGKNDMYQGLGNIIQSTGQVANNFSGLKGAPDTTFRDKNLTVANTISPTPMNITPTATPYIIR